jgi:RNA polymerase sigma factor (TIGR02999 family)
MKTSPELPELDVTTLLQRVSNGDQRARDELFRRVEKDLRRHAHGILRHERPDPLLQTTALIDDAFLKLTHNQHIDWQHRAQFYRWAARVMRQLLVSHARWRDAQKRHADLKPLDQVPEPAERQSFSVQNPLELDQALTRLAQVAPELADLVELHHFGGRSLKQIAEHILCKPYREVADMWGVAKAFLRRELLGGPDVNRDEQPQS